MTVTLHDEDRRIVPRWRDAATTAALGELSSPTNTDNPFAKTPDFDEKVLDWQRERTIAFAAELVGAALVLGREREAVDAARFLVGPGVAPTEIVKRVAEEVLLRSGDAEARATEDLGWQDSARVRIHNLRRRLNEEPRNSIGWADLAREYASIGLATQSDRAMQVALRSVTGNRFVLRAAARLWLHLGDPEKAHDLLRRRGATRDDPWLLASEVALATSAGRTSRLIRIASQHLTGGAFSPRHLSELASALATVEMNSGSARQARKYFAQSLKDPNDNSVAQATWAARRLPGIVVEQGAFMLPRTFEARAWRYYAARDWSRSAMECELWLRDEPFSTRPAEIGSYVALVGLADWALGERLAKFGLRANPGDAGLLNNLTVALAEQGRLGDAEATFAAIRRPHHDPAFEATLSATGGLIAFRRGDIERGRDGYRKAINIATEKKLEHIRLLAELHVMREEVLSGSVAALDVIDRLLAEYTADAAPDIAEVLARLKKAAIQERSTSA